MSPAPTLVLGSLLNTGGATLRGSRKLPPWGEASGQTEGTAHEVGQVGAEPDQVAPGEPGCRWSLGEEVGPGPIQGAQIPALVTPENKLTWAATWAGTNCREKSLTFFGSR